MNFAEYNVKDANLEEVLLALKSLDTVEAVALGGSRSTGANDENSDYDIYVYCSEIPTGETRENLLEKYCSIAEFGNHYWESEDNTVMNNGTPVDIIYREIDRFSGYIDTVIKGGKAFNGYTTAFWHNIKNSKVLFDKTGSFTKFRDMAQIDFPENLRSAIIKNNRNLLNGKLPSYDRQIKKLRSVAISSVSITESPLFSKAILMLSSHSTVRHTPVKKDRFSSAKSIAPSCQRILKKT